MKCREGFISNSSSQSFVLRGLKMKTEEVAKCLGIDTTDKDASDLYEEVSSSLSNKLSIDYGIEPTGNYFGAREYDVLIIGRSIGNLEDGSATEFDKIDEHDDEIVKELAKQNIYVSKEQLRLYVEYLSNDNF